MYLATDAKNFYNFLKKSKDYVHVHIIIYMYVYFNILEYIYIYIYENLYLNILSKHLKILKFINFFFFTIYSMSQSWQ
jgi:hypothetical protein